MVWLSKQTGAKGLGGWVGGGVIVFTDVETKYRDVEINAVLQCLETDCFVL